MDTPPDEEPLTIDTDDPQEDVLLHKQLYVWIGTCAGHHIFACSTKSDWNYIIPRIDKSRYPWWYIRLDWYKTFKDMAIDEDYPPEVEAAIFRFIRAHHALIQ